MIDGFKKCFQGWWPVAGALVILIAISSLALSYSVPQGRGDYLFGSKSNLVLIGPNAPGGIFAKRDFGARPPAQNIEDISEVNFVVSPSDDDRVQFTVVGVGSDLLPRVKYRLDYIQDDKDSYLGEYSTSLPSIKPKTIDKLAINVELQDTKTGGTKKVQLAPIAVLPKAGSVIPERVIYDQLGQEPVKIHMVQLSALIYLFLLGFTVQILATSQLRSLSSLWGKLAFPVGAAVWVIFAVVCLALKIPLSLSTALLFGVVFLLFSFIKIRRQKFPVAKLLRGVGWNIGIFLMVSIVLCSRDLTVFTYDSYFYAAAGKVLALEHYLSLDTAITLAGYSVALPVIHSLAGLFGGQYFYTFHPMIGISFTLLMSSFFYRELLSRKVAKPRAAILTAVPVLGYFTTFFVVMSSLWVIPNFIAGVYLFLAIVSAVKAKHKLESYWLYLSGISLTVFALTRIEGPLFALVVFVFVFSVRGMIYRSWLKYIVPYFLLVSFWLIRLQSFLAGHSSDFLTQEKTWFIILITAGLLIITSALRFTLTKARLRRKFPPVVVGLLLLLVAFLTTVKMALAKTNFVVMIANLFAPVGLWELFWIVTLPLLLLSLLIHREKAGDGFVMYFIFAYILLLCGVFFFRSVPLRLGFGDSANRMFIHITPVIIYYLAVRFGSLGSQNSNH